jgi:hypothetical protein
MEKIFVLIVGEIKSFGKSKMANMEDFDGLIGMWETYKECHGKSSAADEEIRQCEYIIKENTCEEHEEFLRCSYQLLETLWDY